MTDRELMQMALKAVEYFYGGSQTQVNGLKLIDALRDRLAQPEPTGRELQKMMQSAWKAVRTEYKDDPECCFALGWEAGYGAVAPRVEPPETESGEGFESLPAPPPKREWVGLTQQEINSIVDSNMTSWRKTMGEMANLYEGEPVKYAATKSPMIPDNVFSTNASVYTAPPSIEAAVLAEREACAKLLENGRFLHDEAPAKILAKEAAKAIRARREK